MKEPHTGLSIQNRKWMIWTYENCFVGNECVDWLMKEMLLTRKNAIRVGELLLNKRFIEHVTNGHGFVDAYLFYKFCDSKSSSTTIMTSSSTPMLTPPLHISSSLSFERIIKQGYLEKQGYLIRNWKTRWFILKNGSLLYYKASWVCS